MSVGCCGLNDKALWWALIIFFWLNVMLESRCKNVLSVEPLVALHNLAAWACFVLHSVFQCWTVDFLFTADHKQVCHQIQSDWCGLSHRPNSSYTWKFCDVLCVIWMFDKDTESSDVISSSFDCILSFQCANVENMSQNQSICVFCVVETVRRGRQTMVPAHRLSPNDPPDDKNW